MIQPDDGGARVFVHHSAIIADGFRTLNEHDRVEFETKPGPKREHADRVTVVGRADSTSMEAQLDQFVGTYEDPGNADRSRLGIPRRRHAEVVRSGTRLLWREVWHDRPSHDQELAKRLAHHGVTLDDIAMPARREGVEQFLRLKNNVLTYVDSQETVSVDRDASGRVIRFGGWPRVDKIAI